MITIDQFRQLELKVGRILEAKPHPNADRLLLLTVEVGEAAPKEIIAGIALFYTPADLVGKSVVVVNNLEPAVLRGVTSNGMLLAAQDGTVLTLVTPEKPLAPGSVVK